MPDFFRQLTIRIYEGDEKKLEKLGVKIVPTGYTLGHKWDYEYRLEFKEEGA
jgi:hypothetical protein